MPSHSLMLRGMCVRMRVRQGSSAHTHTEGVVSSRQNVPAAICRVSMDTGPVMCACIRCTQVYGYVMINASCICMQVTWTCEENIPSWTAQDITVLCLIFCSWERLKAFEASSRPMQLKAAALRKFLHQRWLDTCALRLQAGLYMQKKGRKLQFDGASVLQFVGEYRSRTKPRERFIAQLKHALEVHYASLPEIYRPADKHQPLHKHWQQAARAFRPAPIPRVQLMRKVLSACIIMHMH